VAERREQDLWAGQNLGCYFTVAGVHCASKLDRKTLWVSIS